ncbi:biotin-dependent carboxyltransferase family protein [Oceanospirillum sp.]|uniref:5-oxoprolinase subunit C family protein n=1 Tax=Oceanospirillum sp. TaxID=2021254 RepID=UPI003A924809
MNKQNNEQQGLNVIHAGFLTLLQDAGRSQVMHQGLANGGPMDRHAWAWANRLLGNAYNTPALEITFGGLQLESQVATRIAMTGADVLFTLNNKPQPLWSSLNLMPGDRLKLDAPKAGLRSYLAVSGGFNVPQNLGDSCATLMREGTGGQNEKGQKVAAGDWLPCHSLPISAFKEHSFKVPEHRIPDYKQPLVLDVILGAQVDRFPSKSLAQFFNETYRISPQTDRMGARLDGPRLEVVGERLISEGISLGAIQVTADGQPIILLNDRQTIGGYPKLGAVTPRSLDALAQRPPGSDVRFKAVSLYQAQLEERAFMQFFKG